MRTGLEGEGGARMKDYAAVRRNWSEHNCPSCGSCVYDGSLHLPSWTSPTKSRQLGRSSRARVVVCCVVSARFCAPSARRDRKRWTGRAAAKSRYRRTEGRVGFRWATRQGPRGARAGGMGGWIGERGGVEGGGPRAHRSPSRKSQKGRVKVRRHVSYS